MASTHLTRLLHFFEEESFELIIKSTPSSSCPSAQKSINLIVNRFDTQYEAITKKSFKS